MSNNINDNIDDILFNKPDSNQTYNSNGLIVNKEPEEKVNDGYVVNVLCESCGFIQVDHNGKKVPWLDENKSRQ